jgi:SAM-dependent methyltransferase
VIRRGRLPRFPPLAATTPVVPDDQLRSLVSEHLGAGDPTGWFEPAYRAVVEGGQRLPWQEGAAHPWVASWLDGPVHTPPGRRALVVGCATGEDVRLLAERGYEVVGIDVAPTALAWARELLGAASRAVRRRVTLFEADLLTVDAAALGPADLVVEVHTVPWLPGLVQDAAMAAIGPLLSPGGVALTITELRQNQGEVPGGPPWPQAPSALAAYRAGGLVRLALEHPPADAAGPLEVRCTWQRPRTPQTGALAGAQPAS